MSELGARVLVAPGLGFGLVMVPCVGFMAAFVGLAFAGIVSGHSWSRYYLVAAAWISLRILDHRSLDRLLPPTRGGWPSPWK